MDNMVQITKAEFESLLKAKFNMEMVKDVLLSRAKADWLGKYLVWDDTTTSAVLQYILGDAYDNKLEELNNKVEELNNKEDVE